MAKPPENFLLEPTPHKQAADWLRGKPIVSREVFDELLPELKARAFVITGLEDAAVAREIRDAIAQIPEGEDYEKTKRDLEAKLGPWFDEKAASQRAELLTRLHGFQAYRSAARNVHDRQASVFKYRQYISMDDSRVRPSHRALHGVILPADSVFWQTHPGGWGCRCDEVALLPSERDEIAAEDAKRPLEERRVIEGPRLAKLEKEGKLIHFIKGADGRAMKPPLHEWNVRNSDAIGTPQSLRIDPAQIKDRYDDETWADFEASAKRNRLDDGRSVWEWMNGKKAGKTPPPPAKPKPAPADLPEGSTPLSGKLETGRLSTQEAARVNDVLAVIDSVHGDGPLKNIPVGHNTGGSLGAFSYIGGEARGIDYLYSGPREWGLHPELTLAHEIGHWLDKSGRPSRNWITDDLNGELKPWWEAVKTSEAWKSLEAMPRDTWRQREKRDYYLNPKEAWARSYAQFIAEESGDKTMAAQVSDIRGEVLPDRQWKAEDFAPVRAAMAELFTAWGWKKKTP